MKLNKTYHLPANSNEIRQILTDLPHYGRLHPLIRNVEMIPASDSENPSYKIIEQPYSWIPINIQYYATLKFWGDEFEYEITGIPLMTAWIRYVLTEIGPKETEVSFHLKIIGMPLGKNILQSKMVAAQNQLMEAMRVAFLSKE